MPSRRLVVFGWVALAYTVAVILWGAYVRATGSGAGCGDHWPLCDGELIPRSATAEKAIELTHRITSGLAWLVAAALALWCRRGTVAGHPARRGSALVLLLMTTEAAVGAGLVLLELVADDASMARGWWVSAHLVNTFLLLAAASVTAWYLSGGARPRFRGGGRTARIMGAALAGVMVLGASGAVTALGDTLFPAESLSHGLAQDLSATAHLFVKLRVLHPIIGLVVGAAVVLAAGHVLATRVDPASRRLALGLGVLFVAQVGIGFANVALLAPVWLQVVHLLVADLVWISLVLLSAATLGTRVAVAEAR